MGHQRDQPQVTTETRSGRSNRKCPSRSSSGCNTRCACVQRRAAASTAARFGHFSTDDFKDLNRIANRVATWRVSGYGARGHRVPPRSHPGAPNPTYKTDRNQTRRPKSRGRRPRPQLPPAAETERHVSRLDSHGRHPAPTHQDPGQRQAPRHARQQVNATSRSPDAPPPGTCRRARVGDKQ